MIPQLKVRGGEGELWILAEVIERGRKMLERCEVPDADDPAPETLPLLFLGFLF